MFNFDDWYTDNMAEIESKDIAREAWDAALSTAASRLNQLALDNNNIKYFISVIDDCKSKSA